MQLTKSFITIGFSSHRIETLNSVKRLMKEHDVIITEEAQNPCFIDMLNKKISIKEYIREEYLTFPKFSQRYYMILRSLNRDGKVILQIEPFIERLIQIYKMFSDGKRPKDVMKNSSLKTVYRVEKKTTAALLDFYESSLKDSFPYVVEAVMRFAQADAEKFRIRDSMRAEAIAKIITKDITENKRVYVEAGGIHIFLEKMLKQQMKKRRHIRAVSLQGPLIKKMTGRSSFLPPGDLLTIHYILKKRKNEPFERLQAGRSLIYIKLLKKEEMLPTRQVRAPHLEDAIKVNEVVSRLSLKQCEEIYKKIRFQKREEALQTMESTYKDL
jgi:Mor family transcriptional regulator